MVDNIELGTLTSSGWDVTAGERVYEPARLLAASAVAVSAPANTSENILATITIPAGAMGLNGILRITTQWTMTSSGNTKTPRIRLGGIGGTVFLAQTHTTTVTSHDQRQIHNRNSAASQVCQPALSGNGGWAISAQAVTTGTVNTAAAQDLVITGQKDTAGETITLEAYSVELLTRG